MEWTEEKVLNLIELYQNAPVLWDPKNKDYYKKNLKVDAWDNIGGAMYLQGEICKNKMITLLSSYRREKMKMKKSRGTGKRTSEIYDSKWFAFEAMSFLLNRDAPRKSRLNTVSNTMETVDNEEDGGEAEVIPEPTNRPDVMPEPPKKVARQDPKLQLLKEAFGILKSASSKNTQNDEITSFLNFVGSKMMKYSENTKNVVQQGICELIFKADSHYFDQHFYQHTANVGYYTAPRNIEQASQGLSPVGHPTPGQSSSGQLSPGQRPTHEQYVSLSSHSNCPTPGQSSSGQLSPGQPPIDQHYASSSPHSDYSELLDNINNFV